MDLCLLSYNDKINLRATSIHGILWLQTHFESTHWEAISAESIVISKSDGEMLAIDAKEAGLILNSVQSFANSSKI